MVTPNPIDFSWGRGQPDPEAIQAGGRDYDGDLDKKPRAGQILWIRGLTRLQTQVCAARGNVHRLSAENFVAAALVRKVSQFCTVCPVEILDKKATGPFSSNLLQIY